ncbi:TonB-dependent receptor [Sphingomonas sp. MMS24-JH45]
MPPAMRPADPVPHQRRRERDQQRSVVRAAQPPGRRRRQPGGDRLRARRSLSRAGGRTEGRGLQRLGQSLRQPGRRRQHRDGRRISRGEARSRPRPRRVPAGADHQRRRATTGALNRWSVNYLPSFGRFDVKEAYLETVVPLGLGLEFNGEAGATRYSTSGYVTTWKAGATWKPIEDIRFRVTRSRYIRAPNLNELFQAGSANSDAATNPGFPGSSPSFVPAWWAHPAGELQLFGLLHPATPTCARKRPTSGTPAW